MCGISGIINRSSDTSPGAVIRRINDAMAHRGPDADGFFEEANIALGHRRLSILDLSTAANQPFRDASGRYVMVFNGEIYNFAEIRALLTDYPFKTSGDTEVVIAAYAKWGPGCLQLFRGMFALAIWDKEEKSLFLARDRFGVKPLYYFHNESNFIFASEIRAILASGLVPRKADRTALIDYLKYQSFVAPLTIIENVFQLQAGPWMLVKDGRTEMEVYWDITKKKSEIAEKTAGEIHGRIRELLYHAVERRLVSDVPLGAFLSGGIDSSAVVAIMSQVSKSATNAFTITFEEKEYDELPFAELVARKFGVHHAKVLLRATDFLDKLPAALDAMDTPSGDGPNTYVVSEAIRKSGITVALSGIGGDELFAGYPIFHQFKALKKRSTAFDHTRLLRKGVSTLLPATHHRRAKWKNVLEAESSRIADIYPVFRRIQSAQMIRRFTTARDQGAGMTLETLMREKQSSIAAFDSLSQVSIAEYLGYTQSVLLKDADQMSMAVSLEVREPFFDHDLVEYVLNVPDEIKQPVYPKKLLIESLGDLLPDEVVFRKKQGFVLPYDVWMRNELRSFCAERIKRLSQREYFSGEALTDYWNKYLHQGSHVRWADVWVFVVLEHWLEKNQVM